MSAQADRSSSALRGYRRAIMFTGHMIDLPTRARPRFPAAMEPAASQEIGAAIQRLLADFHQSEAVAISSLARGGDILFQEHARARHIDAHVVLPFPPEVFVQESVKGVAGGHWERRFWELWNTGPPSRREVLSLDHEENPYAACNRRLLELGDAIAHEIALVALSDGTADGAGGTQDLVERTRKVGGRVELLDAKRMLAQVTG